LSAASRVLVEQRRRGMRILSFRDRFENLSLRVVPPHPCGEVKH